MNNSLDITDALVLTMALDTRQTLAAEIKALQADMDAASAVVKAELIRLGVDTYDCGDWTPTLSVKERKTLDKVELVQQGVTTAQIERATKVSTYVQLDVRAKKVAS
jgi:intracellular sulfur oxidation DsrE/DsrF family protein